MKSKVLLVLILSLCFTAVGFAQLNIVIDGEKDAFYESLTGPEEGYLVIPYTANLPENLSGHEELQSNADLSASVWAAWDDEYFYIYAEVNDDTVALTNSTDWQNDVIELKVDPDPSLGATAGMLSFNTTALDSDAVSDESLLAGVSNLKYDDGTHYPENMARKVFSNGYIIEERIPWVDMEHSDGRFVNPIEGTIFGLGINVHENENTTGRVGSIQWSSGLQDAVWDNPVLAGTVELLAENKIAFVPESPQDFSTVHDDFAIYDPATWPGIGDILDKQEGLITVDGYKDEFYQGLTSQADGYLAIPFEANIDANTPDTHPEPESNEDLSALVWTAWDEDYFYIYAEVHDDTVALTNGTDWQNDIMELKVDPDPSVGATSGMLSFNTTALDSDAVSDESLLSGVSNLKYDDQAHRPEDLARRVLPDGYILEERIPWSAFSHSDGRVTIPEEGSVFGLAINFHENENTTGRVGSIQWSSSLDDAVWDNPALTGTVELLADNKLSFIPESPIDFSTVHSDLGIYDPANNPDVVNLVLTSVAGKDASVPEEYMLTQNYPNPFNPETNISFNLPDAEKVTLTIFNIAGQKIADLVVGERRNAGSYTVKWNGKDQYGNEVASGIYVYRLKAGNVIESKKMMLVK